MWASSVLSSILNVHFSLKKGKNLDKTSFVLTEKANGLWSLELSDIYTCVWIYGNVEGCGPQAGKWQGEG